ncbi:hypothetical protein [Rhodoligotrophos ferricapiens]|uniref:hypothetical protein n=1 Tax=Rhodoligotrophos ferricapiens TaxID=3069264 RepID=UPI00315D968B
MTVGVPWSIKGIDPEAREAAKEAARKSGLTLGQWLTAKIMETAQEPVQGSQPAALISGNIQRKLDGLEERLAELTRQQQQTAAGRLYEERMAHEPVEALLARVDRHERRTVEAFAAINDRLSGIARQVNHTQSNPSVDVSASLEAALRRVVDHIAANEERNRGALQTLHERLAALSAQAGIAAGSETVGIDPAEIDSRFEALTARLDEAQEYAEAAARRTMEGVVSDLRSELLEREERLTQTINEARAQPDTSSEREDLYRQIDTLSKRLFAVEADRGSAHLEGQVAELTTRIDELDERLRAVAEDQPSSEVLMELQTHIVALTEKLASVEKRFGEIDAVERSVADLFKAMEQSKSEMRALAARTAEHAAGRAGEVPTGPSPELQALQNGLAAVKRSITDSDEQTQKTLVIVHDTLQEIVRRLATVEQRMETASEQPKETGQPPSPPSEEPPVAAQDGEERSADIPDLLRKIEMPFMAGQSNGRLPFVQPPADEQKQEEQGKAEPHLVSPTAPNPDETVSPAAMASADQLEKPEKAEKADSDVSAGPAQAERPIETITRRDDFIAAARRAAQAAAQAPQNQPRRFDPLGKLRALGLGRGGEEKSASPASEADEGNPVVRRKPLVLAGAVLLLLAISAYSLSGRHTNLLSGHQDDQPAPTVAEGGDKPAAEQDQQKHSSGFSIGSYLTPGKLTDWFNQFTEVLGITEAEPSDPVTTGSIGKSSSLLQIPTVAATPASLSNIETGGSKSSSRHSNWVATADDASSAQPAPMMHQDVVPERVGSPALRKAAQAGDPAAQFIVATELLEGDGPSEATVAMRWFQKAAAQGLAPAQYRLGMMFERGTGVPASLATARIWYLRAAEKGNVKAMHNLAVAYAGDGQETPDYAQAARWFAAAAEYGIRDSQYNYGVLLEKGLGVPQNARKAYFWLAVCARAGDKEAAQRADALKSQFAARELAEIDAAVAQWRPRTPVQDANTVAIDDGWRDPAQPDQRASLWPTQN